MSGDKMRKEFEVWAESRGLDLYCSRKDLYEDTETLWAWSAWKASRAALMIELPKPFAVVGDYAACGGGKAVWDVEYAEKIDDRMCEKTAVYDRAGLEAAGLRLAP